MKKYRCTILDDEPLAIEVIENYIQKSGLLTLVSKHTHATEAKVLIEEEKPDILFLDIEMPAINGLDFLRALKVKPVTIITTAYRQYALDGFDAGVIDYLLKPVKLERFEQACLRAIELLDLIHVNAKLIDSTPDNQVETITIKSGTRYTKIDIKSITHVQGLKDYAIVYAGKQKHVILGYMKIIASKLPDDLFIRVHKSFIVSRNRIRFIQKGKIHLEDDQQIPIGRSYKKTIDALMKTI
jgi:DNA-binding LytR/AlgR family response regulator